MSLGVCRENVDSLNVKNSSAKTCVVLTEMLWRKTKAKQWWVFFAALMLLT
jgi:hypothetical protein